MEKGDPHIVHYVVNRQLRCQHARHYYPAGIFCYSEDSTDALSAVITSDVCNTFPTLSPKIVCRRNAYPSSKPSLGNLLSSMSFTGCLIDEENHAVDRWIHSPHPSCDESHGTHDEILCKTKHVRGIISSLSYRIFRAVFKQACATMIGVL